MTPAIISVLMAIMAITVTRYVHKTANNAAVITTVRNVDHDFTDLAVRNNALLGAPMVAKVLTDHVRVETTSKEILVGNVSMAFMAHIVIDIV